jgi:glycosyltransferase involved in cell wall biosynthesis
MIQKVLKKIPLIGEAIKIFEELHDAVDIVKCRMDVSDDLFDQFQSDRKSTDYQGLFSKKEPLVSVCIPTYNRAHLLRQRSLPSLLNQNYRNLEIIIAGDCCTDRTEDLISELSDPRVRFVNLSERGKYPDNWEWRWMVAGTLAMNHALSLAKGDFITHLDDDDEHLPDRVSKLVQFVQRTRADLVWHPFWREIEPDRWQLRRAEVFRKNQVTTSSVFYHSWFKRIPWDINAYKYREPGDWNRFRKFNYLGAKMARFPEPLLRHYKERSQARA